MWFERVLLGDHGFEHLGLVVMLLWEIIEPAVSCGKMWENGIEP